MSGASTLPTQPAQPWDRPYPREWWERRHEHGEPSWDARVAAAKLIIKYINMVPVEERHDGVS